LASASEQALEKKGATATSAKSSDTKRGFYHMLSIYAAS
jgi:hypothetical protein